MIEQKSLTEKQENLLPMPIKEEYSISDLQQATINRYKWKSLPLSTRAAVQAFYWCHYFLLIFSIFSIGYRRLYEREDIEAIEFVPTASHRDLLYRVSGIFYAKHNLEIINFLFFYMFVTELKLMYTKYVVEAILFLFVIVKIYVYSFLISEDESRRIGLNTTKMALETSCLVGHMVIIWLYAMLLTWEKRDEVFKYSYGKEFLGKKLKIKN